MNFVRLMILLVWRRQAGAFSSSLAEESRDSWLGWWLGFRLVYVQRGKFCLTLLF